MRGPVAPAGFWSFWPPFAMVLRGCVALCAVQRGGRGPGGRCRSPVVAGPRRLAAGWALDYLAVASAAERRAFEPVPWSSARALWHPARRLPASMPRPARRSRRPARRPVRHPGNHRRGGILRRRATGPARRRRRRARDSYEDLGSCATTCAAPSRPIGSASWRTCSPRAAAARRTAAVPSPCCRMPAG